MNEVPYPFDWNECEPAQMSAVTESIAHALPDGLDFPMVPNECAIEFLTALWDRGWRVTRHPWDLP